MVLLHQNCSGDSGWRGHPARDRICKRLRRPEIDSEDSIPSAYVAWLAGTTTRAVVPARQAGNRFLGPLHGLQIRARDLGSRRDSWHAHRAECRRELTQHGALPYTTCYDILYPACLDGAQLLQMLTYYLIYT
jgi:hypothetical protein